MMLRLLLQRFAPRWVAGPDGVGLTLTLANIKFYTTALNPWFVSLGRSNKTLLSAWFTGGVLFGFVAMLGSIAMLVGNLAWSIAKPSAKDQFLTPVVCSMLQHGSIMFQKFADRLDQIPGVNVPTTQLWYFFIALLFSGIFHEIGHAIAAVSEGRSVRGFGVFVFLIYPGALVDISNDLHVISPMRQLRIFCAGAWHNFVIVVVAFLALYSSSIWMSPLYSYPDPRGGAVIASVAPVRTINTSLFAI
jgi:S2P endopeptidase